MINNPLTFGEEYRKEKQKKIFENHDTFESLTKIKVSPTEFTFDESTVDKLALCFGTDVVKPNLEQARAILTEKISRENLHCTLWLSWDISQERRRQAAIDEMLMWLTQFGFIRKDSDELDSNRSA